LALFVAVFVLGAVVLSRRSHVAQPDAARGRSFRHAPRRRIGVVAVVLGATAAAVLVVMAGAALWRAQGQNQQVEADTPRFSGQVSCTLDREESVGAAGVSDMSFSATGALCVNERTLYAPAEGGRFQRAIVLGEARALDVLTIDPANGEFRRERYRLSEEDFEAANQAVAASGAGRGCQGEGASEAVARRNETLRRFAQGAPRQRLVWRCEARG
jgi:serine protease Do